MLRAYDQCKPYSFQFLEEQTHTRNYRLITEQLLVGIIEEEKSQGDDVDENWLQCKTFWCVRLFSHCQLGHVLLDCGLHVE